MLARTKNRIQARIVASLRTRLLPWYRGHRRDLPWRRTRDPYAVLVSEIMLQQTRVSTVIPYFERWIKAFPDARALARARLDRVLSLWAGLGYYSRARHLHNAARAIVAEHGGRVPCEPGALLKLPGVGRYTAGAVASIAFNRPAPILDGNVIRVLARLFCITDDTTTTGVRDRLWALAERIIPPGRASDFNQAMMELGALVCVPGEPKCGLCPLAKGCEGRKRGKASLLPVLRKRQPTRDVRQFAAICRRGNRVLLRQRREGELMAGLWAFPRCETKTELRRHYGVNGAKPFAVVTHAVMNQRITVVAYHTAQASRRSTVEEATDNMSGPPSSSRWVPIRSLPSVAMPTADRKLAALLR